MTVRYDALSETLLKKKTNQTEGQVTATCEKRYLSFLFQAPRMICPEPVPCQTTAPTEKPYGTSMFPRAHRLPEENVDFGETFPFFSAFWTLCLL